MSELKPCRKCGKRAIIESWSSGGMMYMAKCSSPDCDVPPDGYPKGRSPASVIKEWNRRDKNG